MENRKTKIKLKTIEIDFKKSVDELAEAIVEEEREAFHSDLEPFEAYAQRVKAQLHTDMNEFRERFTSGYEVLLNEIVKEGEGSSKDESPPPGAIIL